MNASIFICTYHFYYFLIIFNVHSYLLYSSQSLPNLDKESDTTHGNKEAEVSSEIGHDPVIGVQGIPVDDTDENSGNLTTLQSSVGTSLQHSRGRPPTGAPSSLLSKHPPNRLSQRNLNIDHRNHSHTHGVCHDETTGRLNHSGVIASSDISHLMSSVALGLRLRDLRRLDFSINPNEQLDVQVNS